MRSSYIGHVDQDLLLRNMSLEDGPGRGMRVIQLLNRAGLFLEILPDRGLDINAAAWNGKALAWLSPAGPRHAAFYEPHGLGWLRTFSGGLVATCGLESAGAPSADEGVDYGLHGRFNTTPAEEVYSRRITAEGSVSAEIGGVVRQGALFRENLTLTRTIRVPGDSAALTIEDKVVNTGNHPDAVMLLYHVNLGYPLIQKGTHVVIPEGTRTVPRDAEAEAGAERALIAEAPARGYKEKVYYHETPSASEQEVRVLSPMGFGLKITFSRETLTELAQWKMMGEVEYVMGIEPATNRVGGRATERAAGRLKTLAPGESLHAVLTLEVLERT